MARKKKSKSDDTAKMKNPPGKTAKKSVIPADKPEATIPDPETKPAPLLTPPKTRPARYVVAPGQAVSCRAGIKSEGQEIKPQYLGDDPAVAEKSLARLVANGVLRVVK